MSIRKIKVEVKILEDFGKSCLYDFNPKLKEGDIIEGMLNDINNAVDFTWNGDDAVLWLDSNCIETKSRKKGINLKKVKK